MAKWTKFRGRRSDALIFIGISVASLAVGCSFGGAQSSNHVANPSAESAGKKSASLAIGAAFRRGLGSIKGHVDLLDPKGTIFVSRSAGAWLIQLTNYTHVPQGSLAITVSDDGSVTHALGAGAPSSEQWLKSPPLEGHLSRKTLIRPEVAFRKGVEALVKWRIHDEAKLADPQGRIMISPVSNGWVMDVFGYPGLGIGGWWITIHNDGEVAVRSGF